MKKKSKTVSAKVDDAGRVKLVASEGTPDGTAVRVLYVVKHADRTFDVLVFSSEKYFVRYRP